MFRRFPIWDDPRPVVIRNNIYTGPIMPKYYHYCNNGFPNSGFQNSVMKWMGWGMAFNMINNMFNKPQQSYTTGGFYPYVDLSSRDGAGGSSSALNQNSDLINCQQLYGNKYKFSKVGENYYAVSADGKRQFSGATPEELLEELKTSKGSKVTETDDNKEVKLNIVKPEEAKETKEEEKAEIVEDGGNSDGTSNASDNVSHKKAKFAKLVDNCDWIKFSDLKDTKFKARFKKGMTAEQVLIAAMPASKDWKKEVKDKYIQYLKDANPTAINSEGKVTDLTKLDLIGWKHEKVAITKVKTNPSKSNNKKIAKYEYKNTGGDNYLRINYGTNMIYKNNGTGDLDGEAVFKINNKEYKLSQANSDASLCFYQITDQRYLGSDFKLIDPNTGHFNSDSKFWESKNNGKTTYKTYKFKGEGPLNGGVITYDPENKKVVLKLNNGKTYPMDDIMLGTQKV